MGVISRLESLPSELLVSVTDYLSAPSDIKAWRLCSKRLSDFGGLFETLNVYLMTDSLFVLRSIARHPVLKKDVRKVVCWLPLFYESLFTLDDYKLVVYEKQCALKYCQTHCSEVPEEVARLHREDRLRAALAQMTGPAANCRDDELEDALRHYKAYYSDQEAILANREHVTALKEALPKFPTLRNVTIGYIGVETPQENIPKLKNDILWLLGHQLPFGETLPSDFAHNIFGAIAAANVNLHTLELEPLIWAAENEYHAAGGLRTLTMSDVEYEALAKAIAPLRRLTIGMQTPHNEHEAPGELPRQFIRPLSMPNLEDLKLTLPFESDDFAHHLFDGMKWPKLKKFEISGCLTIRAEDLVAFLERHEQTLVRFSMRRCLLEGGLPAWKPMMNFMKEYRAKIIERKKSMEIELEALRRAWGAFPFVNTAHESQSVTAFLEGWGEWTLELDTIYGDQSQDW